MAIAEENLSIIYNHADFNISIQDRNILIWVSEYECFFVALYMNTDPFIRFILEFWEIFEIGGAGHVRQMLVNQFMSALSSLPGSTEKVIISV